MPKFNAYTQTNDEPDYLVDYWPKGYSATTAFPNQINILQYPHISPTSFARSVYNGDLAMWAYNHQIPQAVLDEWAAQQIAWLPANDQQSFWQRMKSKYQTVVNNAVNTAQNLGNNVVEFVQNAVKGGGAGAAVFNVLMLSPFRFAMIAALKKKGISISNNDNLQKVAILFYQAFVKGQNSFEMKQYESLENLGGPEDILINPIDGSKNPVSPDQMQTIIKAIMDKLKALIAKKNAGIPLTAEEQKLVLDAEKASEEETTSTDWTPALKVLGTIAVLAIITKLLKWW